MNAQETLRLLHRFKTAHAPLSYPCRLVRKLSAVVGVSGRIVNRVREQVSMRDAVASQLIGHYFSRFTAIRFEQTLEETRRCLSVSTRLQKHINHFTILIDRTPI
jgi:hypothetical protein